MILTFSLHSPTTELQGVGEVASTANQILTNVTSQKTSHIK